MSNNGPTHGGLLQLDIVNMEGTVWAGQARLTTLPGTEGAFGVMPRHEPLLTRLREGIVHIEDAEGTDQYVYVSGGFAEIQPYRVMVLADTAVRSRDLDDARAAAARQQDSSHLHAQLAGLDHAVLQAELVKSAAAWASEVRRSQRR